MIHVTQSFLPPIEDFWQKLESIWQNAQLTNNGPFSKELTAGLCNYLNIREMSVVSNGTLALQLAIRGLDVRKEVITTPFSYIATASSALWEGCRVVFVDIDPATFCIDAKQVENAMTSDTEAILATHVYGYPCDIEAIEAIAQKNKIKVIYDAAHCFGAKYRGKSLCSYGDASTLSFHATKLFHSAEGGAVVCKDEAVTARLELIKKFGHFGEDHYYEIGINAKLSELHAAMGLCVLPHVDNLISARKERVDIYDSLLTVGDSIQRPYHHPELEYNYAYYPVVLPSAELTHKVLTVLKAEDIIPRRYFFPSLNTLPYLTMGRAMPCPVSEDIAQRVLALPLSHALPEEDVERIARLVLQCLR